MFSRLLICLSFISSVAFADPTQVLPDGRIAYYGEFATFLGSPVKFSSSDIKKALYDVMSSSHLSVKGKVDRIGACEGERNCYRHQEVGYSRARIIMFGELFVERDDKGTYVDEVYCQKRIYYKQATDISRMNNVVNIEHTWPQSKFSRSYGKELQKSDLHHLFPTDSKANGIRGNHAFGEVLAGYTNNALCEASSIDQTNGGLVFAPPAEQRGNTARAMFYFSIRYQMPIDRDQEATLRQWHKNDPIDTDEIERNNKIAAHQKSRNPFVDFPELVDQITDF
ncbi:MAG: endonuclease I family protein [Bacteriovoracia bacterium]